LATERSFGQLNIDYKNRGSRRLAIVMPVNLLNLPGLDVVDFKESETEYHVRAKPKSISRICPLCGPAGKVVIHENKTLFVRDLPSHGHSVAIHLDVPRFKCHACVKTFTAVVPEIDTDRQMTERLRKWIGRQALDYPFTEIAKQVGVDEKTVRIIFAEYVKELERDFKRETPVILGLDEIYLSTPRGVITNIGERCLVDMLDNRRKTTIIKFLRSLPNPEKIQAVSTDMYRPYREAIQEVLPHAIHVVDKYHIIRMGNEALELVRRQLKGTIPGKLNLQLKRERKLLTMRQHELTDFQWLAVSGWLNNFPQLKTAYELKERYFKIWNCTAPDEAFAEYLMWQESIPNELAKQFRAITTAWRTWQKQILAYFECPITNAFTESFNSKIRKVYQEGNGYSFDVLRAKVLFLDILQKKTRRIEHVKVKKRPRFDEIEGDMMCFMVTNSAFEESQYVTRQVFKEVNLGTDLSTLMDEIDTWTIRG
jgi:transposase